VTGVPGTADRRAPASEASVEQLLEGLNPPQREAVVHPGGPLLILAGAGSGKTRVLTHRIAWLLRTGQARADEILAITFTNKAAQEMRERVELLVGRAVRAMWVMTFHSACARMLRADAHRLGYTRQFTIYDGADSRRLIKKVLDDLDVDAKRFTPRAMQVQISDAKNKLRSHDEYRQMVGSYFEQTVADVYEHYERELHRSNAMDFDDLLVRAVNVLELFQEVRDRYANAFRWILVDEYQDTNRAQYRWLQLLASEHRNLSVVGDDDQCLVAGTPITMADGTTKPIEHVQQGDLVLSCYGSGDFRPARVMRTFASRASVGIEITTAGGRRIVSTEDHTHFAGFHVPNGHEGRRHNVTVTLCGDRRGRTPMHLVAVGGRDLHARAALERAGLSVRPAQAGSESWRHESRFEDFGEAMRVVGRIREATPVGMRCMARLGASSRERNALPFVPARSVRPGMVMFTEAGAYDLVTDVRRVALERPVHDVDVEGTHNFIAAGIVTHNSIYGFRGAEVANILNFEDDFPDAHTVKLEQNYRSTQTILSAANAVVANNRGRKSKALWTELGEGDPIKVRELADEHAEARYVTAEIERLVDEGVSRSEIAVFYRTNAQSRVLEDMLVRAQIGYQVIGGTKFYERAEVRDAVAYLTFLVNPQDGGSFTRIANSPRRGIGQTSLGRVLAHADALGVPVWEAAAAPDEVPGLATAARRALGRFMSTLERLRERVEGGAPVGDVLEETLRESGYLDFLQAERTIEAQGRIENLEELVRVAREYDATASEPSVGEFLQQISLLSDADSIREDEGLVTLMTLHNAKGLEFGIVFVLGCEDGVFPHARALDEGDVEEERRLAYVGITRAMRDLYLTYARRRNVFGSNSFGLRSRFIDEIPRELTDQPEAGAVGSPFAPGRVASWASAAAGTAEAERGRGAGAAEAAAAVFSVGDDVVHAAFGEGVVTGVEPGGVVVVRFAGDGSERKLMADYAPIRRR
jgi:superfamily I DNA/RNA helicase